MRISIQLSAATACDLLMEDAGLAFRATKDLDVVLIVEMLDDTFASLFWQFIYDGAYQNQEKSSGKQQFYRFSNPADTGFPFMIELFSRKPVHFLAKADTACVPIHISDEVSSLSAILLDADSAVFKRLKKNDVMQMLMKVYGIKE